ncbi:MAG TPA: hypothetical protein VGN41_09965 [Streptosporangiaceae bacterium]
MLQGIARRLSRPARGADRRRAARIAGALAPLLTAGLNLQCGRCLDDPSGNTVNGTQLQIYDCNGLWTQQWAPAV